MPPLSEYCMGNFIWRATTLFTNGEAELEGLVYLLREAITKVNSDFVKSLELEGEEGLTKICNIVKDISGECNEVDFVGLSSWWNLGLYEIDFGWGKPTMGLKRGWTLDEAAMGILEVDKELLEYVTLDPSPLGLST
ncbi:hypothetical protein Pint_09249 [Pistacia integerrima]|uniref:Uncharacterized protein n=1 Tax=Pistacia integerrima TaxID=434235 RepID=A0ACC0XWE8_9ROSI|nr:hypothetical protein Pint_09249 [Pistacia integerrima]